ncbi:MAG: DegT/DnrJ/EryC1/StrS family aminotransferase [Eubacteriales bacterium]|nr:DegT/DnrJ/EryC1/StrS family aminotransferase [Eubacteriales bacterium]
MKIIPNNLKRMYDLYATEYEAKALEVLRSGWYVLGKEVSAFETEFAAKMGAKHCVGLANGLDALWMSVLLLGIGTGDEVIVCSNAYIACVMGITKSGATPVFVEPDAYDNIDADKLEAAITDQTKAIMPVHLYGMSCDMEKIMTVAKKHNLMVIEDCAQAHGTHFQGKALGTFGNVGCFSFYPTKGLGAFGDGGCILTDDEELADRFRTYRNYGSDVRYHFKVVGTNSRLDELQAGLLRVKLTHLDEMNAERREIAKRYENGIQNPLITLPRIRPESDSTWHQYVIHCALRDELAQFLLSFEIGTVIHYPIPPHLSEAYQSLGYHPGDFPIAERYANEVLSLPMYNGMTLEEQSFVIEKLNAFHPKEG